MRPQDNADKPGQRRQMWFNADIISLIVLQIQFPPADPLRACLSLNTRSIFHTFETDVVVTVSGWFPDYHFNIYFPRVYRLLS